MKIHDFGLWFEAGGFGGEWSTTIPPEGYFHIYYNGEHLGHFGREDGVLWLSIYIPYRLPSPPGPVPHIIRLKNKYYCCKYSDSVSYFIGRRLTREDFDIVKNPNYQEQK